MTHAADESPFWQTRGLGRASSLTGIDVDARGGGRPIRITRGRWAVTIDVPGEGQLPPADEQFVCDQTLHVMFPQHAQRFAVRLAIEPIRIEGLPSDYANGSSPIVLECRLSVQTDLLDSHPCLEMNVVSEDPGDGSADELSPPAWIALSGRDRPHTASDDDQRCVLFSEFLEKGVIRRAQPWIVFGRREDSAFRKKIADMQSERPVVLA